MASRLKRTSLCKIQDKTHEHKITSEDLFCGSCGKDLYSYAEITSTHCSNCGYPVLDENVYCTHCGSVLKDIEFQYYLGGCKTDKVSYEDAKNVKSN
jgi:predicted amidophosphoribosyltransferase